MPVSVRAEISTLYQIDVKGEWRPSNTQEGFSRVKK